MASVVGDMDADVKAPDRVLEAVGDVGKEHGAVGVVWEKQLVGFEQQCSAFMVPGVSRLINILIGSFVLGDSRHLTGVEKVSGQSALLFAYVWALRMRIRIVWLSTSVQKVRRVAHSPFRNNMD